MKHRVEQLTSMKNNEDNLQEDVVTIDFLTKQSLIYTGERHGSFQGQPRWEHKDFYVCFEIKEKLVNKILGWDS